jgi:hypothetical protein
MIKNLQLILDQFYIQAVKWVQIIKPEQVLSFWTLSLWFCTLILHFCEIWPALINIRSVPWLQRMPFGRCRLMEFQVPLEYYKPWLFFLHPAWHFWTLGPVWGLAAVQIYRGVGQNKVVDTASDILCESVYSNTRFLCLLKQVLGAAPPVCLSWDHRKSGAGVVATTHSCCSSQLCAVFHKCQSSTDERGENRAHTLYSSVLRPGTNQCSTWPVKHASNINIFMTIGL